MIISASALFGLASAWAQFSPGAVPVPSTGPDILSPLLAYGPLGIAAILLVLFVRQQLNLANKEKEEWQQRYIALADKAMNEYVPAGAKLVETAERVLKFGTEIELLVRKSP